MPSKREFIKAVVEGFNKGSSKGSILTAAGAKGLQAGLQAWVTCSGPLAVFFLDAIPDMRQELFQFR